MKKILFLFFILIFFSLQKFCKCKNKKRGYKKSMQTNTTVEKKLKEVASFTGTDYTLQNIKSEAINEAKTIDTILNSNEEKSILDISASGIKAALLIIFTYTLQKICNVDASTHSEPHTVSSSSSGQGSLFSFSFSWSSPKKHSSNNTIPRSSHTINDNHTIAQEFNNNNIIKKIAFNSDIVISVASKLCSEIINNIDNLEYTLSEENNFHNLTKDINIMFDKSFRAWAANEYDKERQNILAAEIILFGIKNFRSEIKEILQSFSTSTCLTNLLTASTTEPALFTMNKNTVMPDDQKEAALISENNLQYQKISYTTLTKIGNLLNIKLTNLIIPESVKVRD